MTETLNGTRLKERFPCLPVFFGRYLVTSGLKWNTAMESVGQATMSIPVFIFGIARKELSNLGTLGAQALINCTPRAVGNFLFGAARAWPRLRVRTDLGAVCSLDS